MTFDEFCARQSPHNRKILRRMRKRQRRMIRDLETTIATKEWWATNRPTERPFDAEADRVLLSIARRALAALERCDMSAFNRIAAEQVQYAEANFSPTRN